MTRALFILTASLTTMVAAPAAAQWSQPLRSAADAAAFCRFSAPGGEGDEEYDTARRRAAQRPVEVWLEAAAAPVIGYDRVTGSLEIGIYRAAAFAEGNAVASSVGTVGFEMSEEAAQTMWARYEAGTATLKLTFFPLAWSDYEKPFCRKEAEVQLVDAEVLKVELVDEVGRPLSTFHTPLGHEVALMRQHRIQGYLDSGTPVVTVSALAPLPDARAAQLDEGESGRVKSALRGAIYGCYLKGLSANARLQGALVVKLSAVEGPTVLVDSLHEAATSACALKRISEIPRPEGAPALKATLIFRLEDAPGL